MQWKTCDVYYWKPHGNSLHRGTVKNVDDLDFRLLRTQHARENAEHDSCTAGANASVCRAPWHVAHYRWLITNVALQTNTSVNSARGRRSWGSWGGWPTRKYVGGSEYVLPPAQKKNHSLSLHCALAAVQCIVIAPICVFVGLLPR